MRQGSNKTKALWEKFPYAIHKKKNENTNNNNVLQPVVTKIEVPSVSFFSSLYFYFYTLLPISRWILLHPVLLCNDNVPWIIPPE